MPSDEQVALEFASREADSQGITIKVEGPVRDGFAIHRDAEAWSVHAGNARSLLWGIYHIRDGGGEGDYSSDFTVRGIFPCEALERMTPEQVASMIDRMAHWRMNRLIVRWHYGYQDHAPLIHRLCAERGIELSYYMESVLTFCQGADPALFARNEDGSPVTSTLINETRLCPSSSDAVEYLRQGARRFFAEAGLPAGSRMIFIDADGYRFCHCEKCRKLRPVEQWIRQFAVLVEEVNRSSNNFLIEYPCYVWRYALPEEMQAFAGVSGILFDTHQRVRWYSLGEDHPLTYYNELESKGDPVAATVPMNRYMYDRLLEWRQAFPKQIYVFENLMIQGSISCPQPYTPQLLEDLAKFRRDGIDGVIYEAFEPGIQSFADQISTLARHMWSDCGAYEPTELEKQCTVLDDSDCANFNFRNCFNVLAYLTTDSFDGLELLKQHMNDPVLHEYVARLKLFLKDRSPANCRHVLEWLCDHRERFDWIYAAFNITHALDPDDFPPCDTEAERLFMHTVKYFDIKMSYPFKLQETSRVVESLSQKLPAEVV